MAPKVCFGNPSFRRETPTSDSTEVGSSSALRRSKQNKTPTEPSLVRRSSIPREIRIREQPPSASDPPPPPPPTAVASSFSESQTEDLIYTKAKEGKCTFPERMFMKSIGKPLPPSADGCRTKMADVKSPRAKRQRKESKYVQNPYTEGKGKKKKSKNE